MSRPTIDPEFRDLLPPQTPQERDALARLLLRDGCTSPLVVWKDHGVLVDGHNRLEICEQHGIPYTTVELEFVDREAVIRWIYLNQAARRNVTDQVRIYTLGMAYTAAKTEPGVKAAEAAKRIAAIGGVGRTTVFKAAAYAKMVNQLPPEQRALELAGQRQPLPKPPERPTSAAADWITIFDCVGRLRRAVDDVADEAERRTPQYKAAERMLDQFADLMLVWQQKLTGGK